jgi:hypothetical protein
MNYYHILCAIILINSCWFETQKQGQNMKRIIFMSSGLCRLKLNQRNFKSVKTLKLIINSLLKNKSRKISIYFKI